jgi:hypothetical protein
MPLQRPAQCRRSASSACSARSARSARSADAERLLRRMICRWPPPTREVLGISRVSLVSLLLFAAIRAADGEEIGVGVGAVYQVERVVIHNELCYADVYRAGVRACCELSGELFDAAPDTFDRSAGQSAQELVAAETDDQLVRAQVGFHHPDELFDPIGPDVLIIDVVGHFETIKIDVRNDE